jgi:hypothetical protein
MMVRIRLFTRGFGGLQQHGLTPEIFVLERIDAAADWKAAESHWIARCRNWAAADLPYIHPPQTRKSFPVHIASVRLLNVRAGG